MEALGVLNLEGFGISHTHPGLGPAGALVAYATENLCAKPENLRTLQEYRSAHTLLVDPATLRNLEIFQSARGLREGSLLSAVDRTATAAGARLLERWLAAPPLDLVAIRMRQAVVGELLAQPLLLAELHGLLGGVRDIPRILGRLQRTGCGRRGNSAGSGRPWPNCRPSSIVLDGLSQPRSFPKNSRRHPSPPSVSYGYG